MCASVWLLVSVAFTPAPAWAHPLSQGSLDVVIHRDRVSIKARVTVEEVSVTNSATTPGALPGPWAATGTSAFEQHAAYLAQHLHVSVDGVPLPGGVAQVTPPDDPQPSPDQHAVYDLIYPLPAGAAAPGKLELRHDVLSETSVAPGVKWEATYIVRIAQEDRPATEGLLLTSTRPVTFNCDWSPAGSSLASRAGSGAGRMFKDYFLHGVRHILTGYDHLLFISALVLGAKSLWDLVKVVTAFTLAHTITLTLAALNVIHVPERIVEPLIAASIVFVALENVIRPGRTRGWGRLGAAFFFGLFHGLGFAGGLLDAMQDMRGASILLAIAAFSVGVEAGHQLVIVPLFGVLKLTRQTRRDEAGRRRFALFTQRFGSAAISLAGIFYLFVAVKLTFTTSVMP